MNTGPTSCSQLWFGRLLRVPPNTAGLGSFYSLPVSQFVNRFAGTASYYARFRPGYPLGLYDLLTHQAGLNQSTSVLDLGCGPGIIALALASRTRWVTGVDPDTEMLKEATVASRVGGIDNVSWVLSTAEDFVTSHGATR